MSQNAARNVRIDSRRPRNDERFEKRRAERQTTVNRRAIRKALREMVDAGE